MRIIIYAERLNRDVGLLFRQMTDSPSETQNKDPVPVCCQVTGRQTPSPQNYNFEGFRRQKSYLIAYPWMVIIMVCVILVMIYHRGISKVPKSQMLR